MREYVYLLLNNYYVFVVDLKLHYIVFLNAYVRSRSQNIP